MRHIIKRQALIKADEQLIRLCFIGNGGLITPLRAIKMTLQYFTITRTTIIPLAVLSTNTKK